MIREEITMYDVNNVDSFTNEQKLEVNGLVFMYCTWNCDKISWARKWVILRKNEKFESHEDLISLEMNVNVIHMLDGVEVEGPYSHPFMDSPDIFWEYKHPDISKVWEWYWKGGRELYKNLESCQSG